MKKKILFLLTSLLLFPMALSSCGKSETVYDNKLDVARVEVSLTNITLPIGNSVQLQASAFDFEDNELSNIDISWHTSNPNVAKVSENGFIIATGSGRAYISAIAGYQAAVCVVSVPHPDIDPVDEYLISESDFTIKTGTTRQLFTSLNGGNVTSSWESDAPSVASISSDGLLTAVQAGKAKITATYEKYSASITVTVKDDAPDVFTISLNLTNLSMVVGEKVKLEATTSSPAEVTFISDNETVASVDSSGLVTAHKAGTAGIIASANKKTAQCFVTVSEGEDEDKNVDVFFYLDYNNVDEDDPNKLLASFKWYQNVPLKGCKDIPADPDSSMASDPAFPYFIGWSSHTIIDSKDDLWDMDNDVITGTYHIVLYGIWSDVPKGEFIK